MDGTKDAPADFDGVVTAVKGEFLLNLVDALNDVKVTEGFTQYGNCFSLRIAYKD